MEPKLIIICGNVGTGKSTLAKVLADRLNYALLRFDDVMWSVSKKSRLFSTQDEFLLTIDEILNVYGAMRNKAAELLKQGKSVVLESMYFPDQRKDAVETGRAHAKHVLLVHVTCDEHELSKRIEKRKEINSQTPGIQQYHKWKSVFESVPDAELTIDTTNLTVEQEVDLILKHLQEKSRLL